MNTQKIIGSNDGGDSVAGGTDFSGSSSSSGGTGGGISGVLNVSSEMFCVPY